MKLCHPPRPARASRPRIPRCFATRTTARRVLMDGSRARPPDPGWVRDAPSLPKARGPSHDPGIEQDPHRAQPRHHDRRRALAARRGHRRARSQERAVDTAPPEIPQSLDVKIPKTAKGRARVSVHETGDTHGRYVAESSPDPVGPTTRSPLPGTGKSRTLTGPSGTKVWVRFARVRGQMQSDWSTPVLVTLP